MRKQEICIVTQSHPSMNPRLVKEADALVEAGYKVSVIAPDFSDFWRKADEEFLSRFWRVVERPRFGPLAPAGIRMAELARRFVAGIAVKNFRIMHPVVVRAALHPVAPALISAAKRCKADLYIAHYPAALPAAAIAAQLYGALYAYDAEDFHPGDLPDAPEYEAEHRMIRSIEGLYLSGCCYVTAAAPLIAQAYRDEYQIELPTTLLNVFPLSQSPHGPTPRGTASPGPSVYWFSQTIGPGRGLECAVKAIGLANTKPHLYLRGHPADGFLETLRAIAAKVGVSDRVHVLPLAAPSEMERLAAAYDIGFVGETGDTRNHRIMLSNKQFTYLQAGLPVAMSDVPSHRAFAAGHEASVRTFCTGDERSLAETFDDLLESPEGLATAREHAFWLGQKKFNWDIEKRTLLQTVEKALQAGVAR
ncbi:MAG: hypothetical protein Q8O37_13870 [Sulfuricellaceae bacterium]|nr:hypothetical protein [Sulfuricellaceae bacterium]